MTVEEYFQKIINELSDLGRLNTRDKYKFTLSSLNKFTHKYLHPDFNCGFNCSILQKFNKKKKMGLYPSVQYGRIIEAAM